MPSPIPSPAARPADHEDQIARISHSGLLQTRYTCTTNLTIDEAYPVVAENRGRRWRLDVPAGVRYLFYGPSYLGEVFSTIVAAHSAQIERIENLKDNDLLSEYPRPARQDASCMHFPDYCNELGARKLCNATVAFGVQRVTLRNGAVLIGMHNNELLSRRRHAYLSRVLHRLRPDHVFYQHPHDFGTYQGPGNAGCAERLKRQLQVRGGRLSNGSNENVTRPPYMENMCFRADQLHTTSEEHLACVGRSRLWDVVASQARSVTIVAPASVVPAGWPADTSAEAKFSRWRGSSVYYTQRRVKRFRCSVMWDLAAGLDGVGHTLPPTVSESWLLLGHQCAVLTDGHEILGGPVVAIAEDLLDVAKQHRGRVQHWNALAALPGFV